MTARHYWIIAACTLFLCGIISFFYLDIPLALWFHRFNGTPFYRFFKLLSRLGESQWYLAGGLLLYMALRKNKPTAATSGLLLFSSVALSGLSADIIKVLCGRARPKLYFNEALYGFDFLHLEHAWISFPSGHSATAFSVAWTLCLALPQYRPFFLLWAALIAFSRIATTQHYLSDVLAGSLLGAAATAFLYHRYFRKPSHAIIPSEIR
ncbi:MAG: phosphatase PAP2 family protein [Chlorobi bacterium]|nr:phosphatase PAP2 family protein [Chlorobiota bacterium]